MAATLTNSLRFKIIFGICWFSLAELQAIVLMHYGWRWQTCYTDALINYTLLAGAALLVAVSLQYYIPHRNRYGYLAAMVTMVAAIWLLLTRTLSFWLIPGSDYRTFFDASIIIRAGYGLLLLAFMALIAVLYRTLNEQHEIQQRKSEAEALSRDAELNNLRQQLQPHFLFNSLNSINALIAIQPQQARTMIQQLSDFLRGTLRKDQAQLISLEEELHQLQLYLEIEKVRFGHRLTTQIENKALGEVKVPALLLQPIVENAIKFGLYDTTGDILISIVAEKQDGYLHVTVTNPFDPETSTPRAGTGFGLHAVKRRLYLLFARNDLVTTAAEDNHFTTTLKIPQA